MVSRPVSMPSVGRPVSPVEQRVNRQARLLIPRRRHIVVEHAADAVLGAEERDQLHARRLVKQIDRRLPVARSAGVIGDQADALALRSCEAVADEDVDAGQDRVSVDGFDGTEVPRRCRFSTQGSRRGSHGRSHPMNRRRGDRRDPAAQRRRRRRCRPDAGGSRERSRSRRMTDRSTSSCR